MHIQQEDWMCRKQKWNKCQGTIPNKCWKVSMSYRYSFIVLAITIEKIQENFTDMMAIFNVNLDDSHVTSVSEDQTFFFAFSSFVLSLSYSRHKYFAEQFHSIFCRTISSPFSSRKPRDIRLKWWLWSRTNDFECGYRILYKLIVP